MDVKSSQVTGNAASHYAAWQLSRRGWNVMLTSRNAKGSDLYCANDGETIFFGVQSKGLTKRDPVGLGTNLANLRSDWWIITIKAKTDAPVCFIMTLDEVKELCHYSDPAKSRTGATSIWLQPSAYDQPQFREAWHRFEMLNSIDVPKTVILPA
ncbi:hypothetical protein HF263_22915 [Rhizobium leguminosarum]|uniref:hypothetical protein n=1 Tax=Rhizobium leguminosarum TaxID=384 RepID=UPI001C922938|nr:hypothetical protein [Rhizobium leguminosarum]MBY2994479.1 hypothetical protein [Rhizobium leguminosarum]MBY3058907.1 hypothetical protein [Rhizobium leguminosarum]